MGDGGNGTAQGPAPRPASRQRRGQPKPCPASPPPPPPPPPRKPPVPRLPHKPPPAARLACAYSELTALLAAEWDGIRGLNLGVRSGTAVVDGVLMRRLQLWAARLHTLAAGAPEAAEALARLVAGAPAGRMQQLQVLLDMTGHEELSDFLRLSAYGTAAPRPGALLYHMPRAGSGGGAAEGAAAAGGGGGGGGGGASTARSWAESLATLGASHGSRGSRGSSGGGGGGGGGGAFGRRALLAGIFGAAAGGRRAPWGLDDSGGDGGDPKALRFSRLLPPGHLLVKTAEGLRARREFEGAVAAARAREPARAAAPAGARGDRRGGEPGGGRLESGGGGGGWEDEWGQEDAPGGGERAAGGWGYTRAAPPPVAAADGGGWHALSRSMLLAPWEVAPREAPEESRRREAGVPAFRAPPLGAEAAWAAGRRACAAAACRAACQPARDTPLDHLLLAAPLPVEPHWSVAAAAARAVAAAAAAEAAAAAADAAAAAQRGASPRQTRSPREVRPASGARRSRPASGTGSACAGGGGGGGGGGGASPG
ncbi:MAG: hypothetical protein J3K34DRAFT_516981 [Monoraphidium minutum]|nr:MAG: hypothetical protein J3K34DRAFT_516981 [Monoraphidium minutum]